MTNQQTSQVLYTVTSFFYLQNGKMKVSPEPNQLQRFRQSSPVGRRVEDELDSSMQNHFHYYLPASINELRVTSSVPPGDLISTGLKMSSVATNMKKIKAIIFLLAVSCGLIFTLLLPSRELFLIFFAVDLWSIFRRVLEPVSGHEPVVGLQPFGAGVWSCYSVTGSRLKDLRCWVVLLLFVMVS